MHIFAVAKIGLKTTYEGKREIKVNSTLGNLFFVDLYSLWLLQAKSWNASSAMQALIPYKLCLNHLLSELTLNNEIGTNFPKFGKLYYVTQKG